MRKWQQNKISR